MCEPSSLWVGSSKRRLTSIVFRGLTARSASPARQSRAGSAAGSGPPALGTLATNAACAALLAAEVIGSLGMWVALPVAWIWIAARVFEATESLAVAGGAALVGLAAFESLTVKALARVDGVWIQLRRRAGREQVEGALTRVVVAAATLGLIAFFVWYYVLSHAFILPFMPSQ